MTANPHGAALRAALACLDLTTLEPDDTPERVRALCVRARSAAVAAVCVHGRFVELAARELAGSGVRVAAVAGGFPSPDARPAERVSAIRAAVDAGADEIDAIVTPASILAEDWSAVRDEVRTLRAACGAARLKAILGTGMLPSPEMIARVSRVALEAGADFLKTSTGKDPVNATLGAGAVMAREIARWSRESGRIAGLKAAGGVRAADQAVAWVSLVRAELGADWITPERFRIGASALLDALARELPT